MGVAVGVAVGVAWAVGVAVGASAGGVAAAGVETAAVGAGAGGGGCGDDCWSGSAAELAAELAAEAVERRGEGAGAKAAAAVEAEERREDERREDEEEWAGGRVAWWRRDRPCGEVDSLASLVEESLMEEEAVSRAGEGAATRGGEVFAAVEALGGEAALEEGLDGEELAAVLAAEFAALKGGLGGDDCLPGMAVLLVDVAATRSWRG